MTVGKSHFFLISLPSVSIISWCGGSLLLCVMSTLAYNFIFLTCYPCWVSLTSWIYPSNTYRRLLCLFLSEITSLLVREVQSPQQEKVRVVGWVSKWLDLNMGDVVSFKHYCSLTFCHKHTTEKWHQKALLMMSSSQSQYQIQFSLV